MARARLAIPLLVTLLAGFSAVVVYDSYASALPPLHADETGHALTAARMAFDLRRGDLGAFVADTQRETMWPFVHPWVLAAFFLAFGVSTEVARASSLALFAAAVIATSWLARELWAEGGASGPETTGLHGEAAWIGVPSALLMVLTPDFWMHSSRVMIEPLGMLMTLACLLAHGQALRRRSDLLFLVVGLLAAVTFLTKYNYGVPLVAALVLASAIGRGATRPGGRATALFVAGFLVPVVAWLAYPFPSKLQGLYGFSVNRDEGIAGLQDLFFYPLQAAATVSWPVTLYLLAVVLVCLWRGRDARTFAAALFVVFSLAMITAHPNKQIRYFFTVLPVLYVLGELELWRMARRWLPPGRASLAISVLLAAMAVTLDPRPRLEADRREGEKLREAGPIVDFIVSRLHPDQRTLVLGSVGLLPHMLIHWEMVVRYGAIGAVVENLPFPGEEGWDPRYRRGYPTDLTPAYEQRLQATLESATYDRIATLAIAEDSAFNPDFLRRWDAWGQNYVVLMERQGLYPLVADQGFPSSRVRVRLYAKEALPQ